LCGLNILIAGNALTVIQHHGFTLLELIFILAIIGILAVAVTPKQPPDSLLVQYEARRVLNDIRYTQALSMSTGLRYRWVKVSGTSYQIVNASGIAIILPNGSSTLTLAYGATLGAITNLPNNLLSFDAYGVPYTTSGIPGTLLSSAATIAVTKGSQTATLTIQPTTGLGFLP
jgi:prepilin-type N-terminal cleavage/methylation domain-containing protein